MPKVSVVIPAYNAEKTIGCAIDSVLKQTFTDFELIVIDDCSKDNTYSIVYDLAQQDDRIVLLKNKENSGVSVTRNYGISEAKGEWIAFLDSDDLWKPEKLEKQLKLLATKDGAVLCYTASSFINDDGEPYSYVMEAEEETSFSTILKRNLISCSSVMIKASVMKQYKMPGDEMHEDYFIWMSVLKDYGVAYGVNEPLLTYRLSSNSKSSSRIKSAKMSFRTYRAYGFNSVVSHLLVLRYAVHSITKRYKIKTV